MEQEERASEASASETASLHSSPTLSAVDSNPEPEKEPVVFELDAKAPEAILQVQKQIKQLAEATLFRWKRFPIVLPPSLTEKYTTDEQGQKKPIISYNDMFVAPSFDELAVCAVDDNGDIKQLNSTQLTTLRQRGEFDVTSRNFPGQVHTWRVTQLLQKGTDRTRDTMLNDAALACKLLLITARNRISAPSFSVRHAVKSVRRGVWQLMDCAVGMPHTTPGDMESRLREEHMQFLVAELTVRPSLVASWVDFCDWVKDSLRGGAHVTSEDLVTSEADDDEEEDETSDTCSERLLRKERRDSSPPLPPYRFQTATGQAIDMRLYNTDVMRRCRGVLLDILHDQQSSGWYLKFQEDMVTELQNQDEPKLNNLQITEKVNLAIQEEYKRRVFEAVENSAELEEISPGLGALLAAEARATVVMETAIEEARQRLEFHSHELLKQIALDYPVRSRVLEWRQQRLQEFKSEFARTNEWSPHEEAIERCRAAGLKQAEYFLQRDLNFRRDREPVLLMELERVRIPCRNFMFAQRIWFPGNWIVKRMRVPEYGEGEEGGGAEVIPTVIVQEPHNSYVARHRMHNGGPVYVLEKNTYVQCNTKEAFWRWKVYLLRTWTWTWNAIFWLGIATPWCSPLSLRALCYNKPFIPALELNHSNGTLSPQLSSRTETLRSRLATLWRNVANSRAKFEAEPDTGLLGKNFTRHLNRFWNYVVKGALGSVALVCGFAPLCLVISVASVFAAVLAPLWMPVLTFFIHLFLLFIYDFDSPGNRNAISLLCDTVLLRLLVLGLLQPVAALFTAGVVLPVASAAVMLFAVVRRSGREVWDALMFHSVLKTQSRTPTRVSFVARRIAGPGLASEYFYQARAEQVLAAVESHMEHSELVAWESHVTRLVYKPLQLYREFMQALVRPFSADLVQTGVYESLMTQTEAIKSNIFNHVQKRKAVLATGLDPGLCARIKLTSTELRSVRLHTARLLQEFYPDHVFARLLQPEHRFWGSRKLRRGDWNGLAAQVLSETFSAHFLTPLEEADTVFRLEIQHLDLARYAQMLVENDPHDDLDRAEPLHNPQGAIDVDAPSLAVETFYPLKGDHSYRKFFSTKRTREQCPWSSNESLEKSCDLHKLQVSLPIMHPAFIAILIHNREQDQDAVSLSDARCRQLLHSAEDVPYSDPPTPSTPPGKGSGEAVVGGGSTPSTTTPADTGDQPPPHLAQPEMKFRGRRQ